MTRRCLLPWRAAELGSLVGGQNGGGNDRHSTMVVESSGGSRMVIKGGLNNEDLRLTLKINGDLPLCNSDL